MNSSENTTVTGSESQIDTLVARFGRQGVFARKLQDRIAYHSAQVNEIAAQHLELIKDMKDGEPLAHPPAMISTLTGNIVSSDDLRQSDYWVDNMISPVRFSEALAKIISKPSVSRDSALIDSLLEIGPHTALRRPVRDILGSLKQKRKVTYDSIPIRNRSASLSILEAIGRLHFSGYFVNIAQVNRSLAKKLEVLLTLTDLPEYPPDHSQVYCHTTRKASRLNLLGTPNAEWNAYIGTILD